MLNSIFLFSGQLSLFFIKNFTRKKQMKLVLILIILGIIFYLLDRRHGATIVTENAPMIWGILQIIILFILFIILPIFGLLREDIMAEQIYKEKIGKKEKLNFTDLSELLNINIQALSTEKYKIPLSKENIKKIIKKYFPM